MSKKARSILMAIIAGALVAGCNSAPDPKTDPNSKANAGKPGLSGPGGAAGGATSAATE